MLKSIIRTLLQKFIDDIDADNCNITMEQQSKIISVLSNIANPDQRMSKIQACDYIGVSRATFDNYSTYCLHFWWRQSLEINWI